MTTINQNDFNDNKSQKKISTHHSSRSVILMAGGSGTRMGSNLPKQLLHVGNKPMMMHLINNVYDLGAELILVLSEKNKEIVLSTLSISGHIVKKSFDNTNEYYFKDKIINICVQPTANGTGGAVMACQKYLETKTSNDVVLILSADVPLITKSTMINMFELAEHNNTNCVILAKNTKDNHGYGRIVTNNNGFVKIVEQLDCLDHEKNITLINTGTYAFKVEPLLRSLSHLNQSNNQNEYYLTDCPRLIYADSTKITSKGFNPINLHIINSENSQFDETIGANTPEQLKILNLEYLKKFSVEKIDGSDINLSDYNIKNIMRILHQLSPNKNYDYSPIDIIKIRQHIIDSNSSILNKKQLFVVKYEDIVVGTGSALVENKLIHDIGKASHIEDVVIDETYRNLGLAKLLMLTLINHSKEENAYKIILDASDDVKGFYEKLGFKQHANSMRMDI